jgi:hypothetical protein
MRSTLFGPRFFSADVWLAAARLLQLQWDANLCEAITSLSADWAAKVGRFGYRWGEIKNH